MKHFPVFIVISLVIIMIGNISIAWWLSDNKHIWFQILMISIWFCWGVLYIKTILNNPIETD